MTPPPAPDSDRQRLPAERYSSLPNTTRIFLESIRDEDTANLSDLLLLMRAGDGADQLRRSIEMAESFARLGKFTRYVALAAISVFTAIPALAAAYHYVVGWFKGPHQ